MMIDEGMMGGGERRTRSGHRQGGSARYLAFALSPFPGTPPPFLGFLQSLQVWRLVHLRPGLFNVSRSMSHGCPRSASARRRED